MSEVCEDEKSVSISPMKDGNNQSLVRKKKSRHRNRKLYSDILKQMEFYFSDSNLHKDKYLRQNMQADGWLDVELFANFNKIKSITADKRILTRALSKSTFLELSSDGKRIRRKVPFKQPSTDDVNQRTIYMEPLPVEADHTYVANLLSSCGGKIVYVSLPRFKRSRRLKGFAFVEFDSPDAVEKACNLFPPSKMTNAAGGVFGRFPQSNKQIDSLKRRSLGGTEGGGSSSECPRSGSTDLHVNISAPSHSFAKPRTRNRTSSASVPVEEETVLSGANSSNHNHHHQHPNSSSESAHISPVTGNKFWVISKEQWLEMKQKYLELQKQRISILKELVAEGSPCFSVTSASGNTAVAKSQCQKEDAIESKGEADNSRTEKPLLAGKRTTNKRPNPTDASLLSVEGSSVAKPKHIKFTDSDGESEEVFAERNNKPMPTVK